MRVANHHMETVRTWLETEAGKNCMRTARERFGFSYKRALGLAVVQATGLAVYERIAKVVDALMEEGIAA